MLRWIRFGLFLLVAFALGLSIHLALEQESGTRQMQSAQGTARR